MKRSEINTIIRSADKFIRECGFSLPPFAYWTPETWSQKGVEVREIAQNHLGWDITDFGSANFQACGLILFTLRNGSSENWRDLRGKLYAEKLLVVDVDQVTPMHFHWKKMEDIINRGGGNLMVQLHQSTPDEKIDLERDLIVSVDGVERKIPPGGVVTLTPGESITLPPFCYHKFWGTERRVLVGEVSLVNDDSSDNRFIDQRGRFPVIEEDEPPLYLLVTDYQQYYRAFDEA
jgi:D-lyxose ketol-isomerase